MILHTLNASPASAAFSDCLAVLAADDALVLMGEGVYTAIAETDACSDLLASGAQIHVLQVDAAAAGVADTLGAGVPIDMDGFVALSERFVRQLAWY